jgi:choline dehydrogenase-like flavoprotein
MITGSNSVQQNAVIHTNVCIVGAGAAGITLAREFIGQPFDVCLLESGSMSSHVRTRSLSKGKNIGNSYRPLEHTRSRSFGGTTDVWGGGCEELDDLDFETRAWIPHSGWPFPKAHLQPFYARARAVCRLPCYAFDEGWEGSFVAHLPLNGNRITKEVLYRSRFTHFGKLYGKELSIASNISIFLNANMAEIITNSKATQVTQLRVSTLDGHQFFVKAQLFILATGGIENPRLLLASNRTQKEGLGNHYDLVGRFFMTHPEVDSGVFLPSGQSLQSDWYRFYRANRGYPKTTIGLSQKAQGEETLLNLKATLHATYHESQCHGVASLHYLLKEFSMGRGAFVPIHFGHNARMIIKDRLRVVSYMLKRAVKLHSLTRRIDAFYLTNRLESAPNPESRVLLSSDRDHIGLPRVKLDWRLSPMDKWSLRRSHEILSEEITSGGVGQLLVQVDKDESSWPTTVVGPCHHIGTTRMDRDPKSGVVDQNCQVHGISNLYIAGSSVFPTSGTAAPMLTIVALAVRLADDVKTFMRTALCGR